MQTVTAPSTGELATHPELSNESNVRALGRCVLFAAIALGLMARVATFQSPLFDLHAWRQADTAAIARNFVTERFDPLYPQIDYRGNQRDGYVETGLELYAFTVAAIARVVGFSTEIGRLLSAFFFPFAAILLYRFITDRYGPGTALVGAAVYAVGLPLTLYIDRAFMNESLLTLLSLGALRSAQLYLGGRTLRPLIVLAAVTTLIAVIKPTYLIVWGPVLGLFAEKYGHRVVLRPELWVLVLLNVGAMAAWFTHAHALFAMTGLTFGIGDKLFDADLLLSFRYLSKISTRLIKDVLGPCGILFLIAGLWEMRRRHALAELAGLGAFVAYLAIVTVGNFHHNYYQLPIVPVAAVLMAVGIVDTSERLVAQRRWSRFSLYVTCAAMVAATAITTFGRSVSFHSWYEIDPAVVFLCNETRAQLGPSERVVIVGSKSPALLFCLDRKGWLLDGEEARPQRLAEILDEGPRTIIVEHTAEEAHRFLRDKSRIALTTGSWTVYRIDAATAF